jgi:TRAP-type C4-dicarboxylate transport system substrate-binding protein
MRFASIFAAAALALSMGSSYGLADEAYPKMNFTYAHIVASNNALAKFDTRWAELVTERSGGNITFKMYWAGSMGGPTEIPDLVGSGAVDFGSTALGYLPSQFPLAGVVGNMQRTFATPPDAREASMAIFALPPVQKELEKANLRLLNTTTANPYDLTCTKPIKTMADFAGTRIRANGKYPPIFFNALGASPQTLAFAEMYEGLEKGLIDCSWMSHDLAISSKLDEVAKYAIDLNLGAVPATQLMVNRKKFDNLPKNVQELMLKAADDSSAEEAVYLADVYKKTIDEVMPAKGMTYVHFEDLNKFRAVEPNMPKIWEKDVADAGMGDAAKQIFEILEKYRAKLVK